MKRYELLKQTINNHGFCPVDKKNMDMIEREIRANERAELLDKAAEKFISWDSKVKGTREDGVCFFTIENILQGIEELKTEASE